MAGEALVLFAHGSREPDWARPLEALRGSIQRLRPSLHVELAYLDLMEPSLPEAAAQLVSQGVRHIRILPVFLGYGSHLRRDLPALADAARTLYPDLTVTLLPALGEQRSILDGLAHSIADSLT